MAVMLPWLKQHRGFHSTPEQNSPICKVLLHCGPQPCFVIMYTDIFLHFSNSALWDCCCFLYSNEAYDQLTYPEMFKPDTSNMIAPVLKFLIFFPKFFNILLELLEMTVTK